MHIASIFMFALALVACVEPQPSPPVAPCTEWSKHTDLVPYPDGLGGAYLVPIESRVCVRREWPNDAGALK